MPKKYLTYQFIKGIDKPEKQIEYYDTDKGEKGLILRVTKAGTKSFAYRYRVRDNNKKMIPGVLPLESFLTSR